MDNLPWFDLLSEVFHEVPIGIPGSFKFGLKDVSTALSEYSPAHAVTWPDGMNSGQAAQVTLWEAYRQEKPLETPEMILVSTLYLEADVRALWCILKWLRDTSKEESQRKVKAQSGSWYAKAVGYPVSYSTTLQISQGQTWYAASLKRPTL